MGHPGSWRLHGGGSCSTIGWSPEGRKKHIHTENIPNIVKEKFLYSAQVERRREGITATTPSSPRGCPSKPSWTPRDQFYTAVLHAGSDLYYTAVLHRGSDLFDTAVLHRGVRLILYRCAT
jgi:hypothetical protein